MAEDGYDQLASRPFQASLIGASPATRRSSGYLASTESTPTSSAFTASPDSQEKKAQFQWIRRSASFQFRTFSATFGGKNLKGGCGTLLSLIRSHAMLTVPFLLALVMLLVVLWDQARPGGGNYVRNFMRADPRMPSTTAFGSRTFKSDLQPQKAPSKRLGTPTPADLSGTQDEQQQRAGGVDLKDGPLTDDIAENEPVEPPAAALHDNDEGGQGSKEEREGVHERVGGGILQPPSSLQEGDSGERTVPASDEGSEDPLPPAPPACNLYDGEWVRDPTYKPPYSGKTCKWLAPNWACRLSPRPRFGYEKMRWKPQGCDLPTFNAKEFFTRMQHRRFAFVGDSLGQQMFLSLLCMLAPKGPPANMKKKKSPIRDVGSSDYGFYLPKGARRPTGWAFRFTASNTTLVFKWNSFLVEQQPASEMGREGDAKKGALHIDRPDEFIRRHLRELDVLVMNTGHHWNRVKLNEANLEFFINGSKAPDVRRNVPLQMGDAHRVAVKAVARWIDRELRELGGTREGRGKGERERGGGSKGARREMVELEDEFEDGRFRRRHLLDDSAGPAGTEGVENDAGVERRAGRRGGVLSAQGTSSRRRSKPLVFMRTMSPRHFMEGDWNSGGRCDHLKSPFKEDEMEKVMQRDTKAEEGVNGTSLHLLNITHLSAYRGEAHPSKWDYRFPAGKEPKGQDCLHWCLPGVPDVWNTIVLAHILQQQ